jgi:predicted dithiol-disulfide oxidoreductase (DUF899 family)
MSGTYVLTYTCQEPGNTAFALSGGVVYRTYSTHAQGLDALWGMYQWLDRAPKGSTKWGCGFDGTMTTCKVLNNVQHAKRTT